ncbi:TadE/TadG family type IV pilus assembly protein [Bradymonas sediminis]|uniref:Uncharacterized protein n=1 Tax=Bradymonas sediminis TaxID=1548548 RepID=A0A2Z4FNE2_9DELT|nr:Tad domain-containing protein [Bradymonas sediminis]AWV90380.1 hypothetical protein DN745_13995 [Bradymonas sediminis]TDP72236.1 putative Flp pilus-assembly TadE/G-like protein [Bradymonas sediminis]
MEFIDKQLRRFHANQSGAIILLVLAALIMVFMMALVVFDAGEAGRDKIRVQQAADTAAWSESAVKARSMNMIAFSNVAKRVTIGMTSFYAALWVSFAELGALTAVATVAACVLAVVSFGSLATICEKMIEFAAELVEIVLDEAQDGGTFKSSLNGGYFKDDVIALDNYQKYMAELTPWWAFAEGIQRGIRNGAHMSASFPVPENDFPGINLPISINGLNMNGSGIDAKLPVERASEDDGTDIMCGRVGSTVDYITHFADYELQNLINSDTNWKSIIIYLVTGGLAAAQMKMMCKSQMNNVYKEPGRPWRIPKYDNPAEWMLNASTLTFAYRADAERMNQGRNRLDLMGDDVKFGTLKKHIYKSGGYLAMSRSEITYQDSGMPDLWHPSWTARMRPVALPDEWSNSGVTLGAAYNDVSIILAAGEKLGDLTDGQGVDGTGWINDLARLIMATQTFDNEKIEGLSK